MVEENHTPIKPLEDSSLTFDESEDLSFWLSKLEDMVKGTGSKVDLVNLETKMEKGMGHIDNNI